MSVAQASVRARPWLRAASSGQSEPPIVQVASRRDEPSFLKSSLFMPRMVGNGPSTPAKIGWDDCRMEALRHGDALGGQRGVEGRCAIGRGRTCQRVAANGGRRRRYEGSPASNSFIAVPTLFDQEVGKTGAGFSRRPLCLDLEDQNLNSARFSGVTIFAGPRINSPLAPIVYSPSLPAVNFSPSLPVILHCASAWAA